ncbi:hypothetical protein JST97_23040 [bacterium]|nr:hypothetical protein [bacterium]
MKHWTVELLPQVVVHVYLHTHLGQPCWSYLTEGLRAFDQSELAFSWLQDPDDVPIPPRPLEFLETVCRLVRGEHRVGPGSLTGFAKGSQVFGRKDVTGVLYLPCPGLQEICIHSDTLSVIPLLGKELERVRDEGPARHVARSAMRSRVYPYPVVFDRKRKAERLKKLDSILGFGMPVIHSWMSHAWSEEGRLTLRIPYYERDMIARALENIPLERPFSILTGIAPDADGTLVWIPGQEQAEVLIPPGSPGLRLSGNFIMFAGHRDYTVSQGGWSEDGFRLALRLDDQKALRQALCRGEAFELDSQPYSLTVETSNNQVMLLNDEDYLEEAGFVAQDNAPMLEEILKLMQATLKRDELRSLAMRIQIDPDGAVGVMFPEDFEFASKNQLGVEVMALRAPPPRLPVQMELHCQL